MNLGLSGRLTRATLNSPLTPLMLLAAIAVGLMAVLSIPREEEPQISVPMVDIMVAAPGLSASDATELAAKPLEAIVRSIDGVEHVYTQVQDDQVMVTARFLVGSDPDDAAERAAEIGRVLITAAGADRRHRHLGLAQQPGRFAGAQVGQ
ncbi:MAG: efflux RND transporter permease subunit, partial [Brevundimonas sp.]